MKAIDLILALIIVLAVILALKAMLRSCKNGGCSCGCGGCAYSGDCEKQGKSSGNQP